MKLIVSDLDGTLLNAESKVSVRTSEALRSAAAAGVHVAAATGRSHRTAAPLLGPVGVIEWAICSNGATLFDLANDTVVSHTFLDGRATSAILAAEQKLPGLGLAWETPAGLFRDRAMHVQMTRRYGPGVWELDADPPIHEVGEQLIKVMVGHPDLDQDQLLETLGPQLGPGLEITSSGAEFIEVTAGAAEKGQAVARLCEQLGVDRTDTVAFGDQLNDLGMLEWAHRGFAMENAHPRVLAATPLRAPHHSEDGVARVIEGLLAP